MRTPVRCLAALAIAAAGLCAQTKEFAVGTLGAKVELAHPWRRDKVDKGDQFDGSEPTRLFRRTREVWVAVTELRTLIEGKADMARTLDERGSHGDGDPVELAHEASWTRATRDIVTRDADWAIRYEVLARDGLAYHLMFWADPQDADFLHERAEDFRDGFVFPGAESAWQTELAAKEHVVAVGEVELVFNARPFVLTAGKPIDGELCRLHSGDRAQALSVFETARLQSLQRALDEELRRLRAWDASFTERRRTETRVDGELRGTLHGEAGARAFVTLVVPAGEQRWIFFRYWCPGSSDEARPERDAVFASVRRRAVAGALQLPPLPAATRSEADATTRFCTAQPQVATCDCTWLQHAEPDGDGWLVQDWKTLLRVTATGTERLFSQEGGSWFGLRWCGEVLVGDNGDVRRVERGQLAGDPLFTATCAAPMQDELLLVRDVQSPLPELSAHAGQTLVLRTRTGSETTLLRLPRSGAMRLVIAPDRRRALIHGHDMSLAATRAASGQWLAVVDLERRDATSLGEWNVIECVGAAGEHWLVTGTPKGEPRGIWLVRSPTDREPLLTGAVVKGIAADDEHVTVLHSANPSSLRKVPLSRCREEGRFCQPFTADRLAEIGSRLVAELGAGGAPRTAADLVAARTRASAFAKTAYGAGLPTVPADVDSLIGSLSSLGVAPPARSLLAVLIAATAVDGGAQWVESPTVWSDWQVAGMPCESSLMARLADPRQLLTAAVDGEYGSAPFASLERDHNGRAVLVGLDVQRLTARAEALAPTDLDAAIHSADVARLAAIVDASPANVILRRRIYERLAAAGNLDAVEALAAPRAAAAQPAVEDLVAWLAVRTQRAQDAAAARTVFDDALRAVQQQPREARLYLFLGRAAARAFPDQRVKARQCFDRVIELQRWGDVADAARRERAALDGR